MTLEEAKRFLVDRIAEQARTANIPLSQVEKEMLLFTEEFQSPEMLALSEGFDRKYDSDVFEAKVAGLIRDAFDADGASPERKLIWQNALLACRGHDFYMLVMIDQAGVGRLHPGSKPKGDNWQLLGVALLIAALVLGATFWARESGFDSLMPGHFGPDLSDTIWWAIWILAIVTLLGYEMTRRYKGRKAKHDAVK